MFMSENEKFWGSLSKSLYFFGGLTLVMEIVVLMEFEKIIDSPLWSIGASVMWLLFLISMILFIVGANIKNFPVPEKHKNQVK